MLMESRPQSNKLRSSFSESGRGGVTATMLAFPGRRQAREFLEGGNRHGRAVDPGFGTFPILRRNGDDRPVEHVGFGRLQSLAAHEVAEIGMRLRGSRFEDGPFVG